MGSDLFLPLVALTVGIKHGVDWDHIAAIMDITAAQRSRRKGVFLSFLYAVGHASVVAALALAALLIGLTLPPGIDSLMEKFVGATLLILGFYVLYSLYRGELRLVPRWAIVANALLRGYDLVMAKLGSTPVRRRSVWRGYGGTSAYLIGVVHGIGAETPTQVMLFSLALSAGAAAESRLAVLLILSFVAGLVVTNTLLGFLGAYGIATAREGALYRGMGLLVGVFSLALGAVFLLGGSSLLPGLLD
jgi:high-affinity nickel-transport protein